VTVDGWDWVTSTGGQHQVAAVLGVLAQLGNSICRHTVAKLSSESVNRRATPKQLI
jgi:hypothetical protein